MKESKFFFLLFIFLTFFSTTYGDCPDLFKKDEELVGKFKAKQIRLIVFRHHESINNFQDIVSSSRSPGYSLTSAGLQELESTAQDLLSQGISVIYTSPLYRSLQATEILGKILQLSPQQLIVDDRLTIQKFGTYEGKDFDLYKQLFSSNDDMLEGNASEGEPGFDVFYRTRKFLWRVAKENDQTILIVTHAFNFNHIKMCLTGEFGDLPQDGEYVIYDFSQNN